MRELTNYERDRLVNYERPCRVCSKNTPASDSFCTDCWTTWRLWCERTHATEPPSLLWEDPKGAVLFDEWVATLNTQQAKEQHT